MIVGTTKKTPTTKTTTTPPTTTKNRNHNLSSGESCGKDTSSSKDVADDSIFRSIVRKTTGITTTRTTVAKAWMQVYVFSS